MEDGSGPVSPVMAAPAVVGVGAMAPGCAGLGVGGVEQAASVPTISAVITRRRSVNFMGLILLEALLALVVLGLIVWWTMFSGRKGGLKARRRTKTPNRPRPRAARRLQGFVLQGACRLGIPCKGE
jgi:hypothetical protein